MANIGSEVERALELIDLTLDNDKSYAHLKEITRLREAIVDYFHGTNQFISSESSWRSYFLPFTYASRRNH